MKKKINPTLALAAVKASAIDYAPPMSFVEREQERLKQEKKLADMRGLQTRLGGGPNRSARRARAKATKKG